MKSKNSMLSDKALKAAENLFKDIFGIPQQKPEKIVFIINGKWEEVRIKSKRFRDIIKAFSKEGIK